MIKIRPAREFDIPRYLEIVEEVWPEQLSVAEDQVRKRMELNPDGVVVAEVDGKVVGMATCILLPGYDFEHPMSWYETTADGWCTTHDPKGKVAFGVDLTVSSKDAPSGTVDALAVGQGQFAIRSGVKYYTFGERLPQYHLYADSMSVEEYIQARDADGRWLDPQVGMYQKVPGLSIVRPIKDYIDDPDSLDWGLLLRWRNPFYGLPGKRFWAAAFQHIYYTQQRVESWLTRRKHKK